MRTDLAAADFVVNVRLHIPSKSRDRILDAISGPGAQHLLRKLLEQLCVAGIATDGEIDWVNVSPFQSEKRQVTRELSQNAGEIKGRLSAQPPAL
jgi:hypothetical protein